VRDIDELERDLLARDFLYDDRTAYREGVLAVTGALRSRERRAPARERPMWDEKRPEVAAARR
jgi:hypothetical protein